VAEQRSAVWCPIPAREGLAIMSGTSLFVLTGRKKVTKYWLYQVAQTDLSA
jgi:hypothetical protein